MLVELEKLIDFIQTEYLEFNKKWQSSNYYNKINLKNNEVCDLQENEELLNIIFNYREFINENNIQLSLDFKQFNTEKSKVNIRAKNKNSIEYKLENYIKNHENGKVPINKCFNDLFGIRIICNEVLSYEQIKELIKDKYHNLKCIYSLRQEYKATHIYFRQGNSYFPWELQVWNQIDEINNIISHEKYKQDYVKWEKSRGGNN